MSLKTIPMLEYTILLIFVMGYIIIEIFTGWDTLRVLTYLLVIVTGYYAWQTRNMVRVVKEQNRPNIRIHLQVKEKQLYMQISNVGSEYAQNVKCVPEPDFQVKHKKFSDVEIMELPMLFGGQMFEILLGDYQEVLENLNKVRTVELVEELPKTERTHQKFAKLSEQLEEHLKKDPIITCTYTEASGKSREIKIPLMLNILKQARTYINFEFPKTAISGN